MKILLEMNVDKIYTPLLFRGDFACGRDSRKFLNDSLTLADWAFFDVLAPNFQKYSKLYIQYENII